MVRPRDGGSIIMFCTLNIHCNNAGVLKLDSAPLLYKHACLNVHTHIHKVEYVYGLKEYCSFLCFYVCVFLKLLLF